MAKYKNWMEFIQAQPNVQPNMMQPNMQPNNNQIVNDLVNKNLAKDPQFVSRSSLLNPAQKMDLITKKSADILNNGQVKNVDIKQLNTKLGDAIGFDFKKVMNRNVPNI